MALNSVKNLFKKYPLASNCVTYGSMCVGAEFSQQFIKKRILKSPNTDEKIDIEALKRYSVIGFVINPNILYFWYKWLDKAYVGTATKIVVKKVLMDQFLMTPPLYVVFYTAMSLMEGKQDLLEECRSKFIPTFQTSCLFWLPVQTINFLFVPNTIRVAYVGTCSFVWINILCWIKRKEL
ncbi:mpv17-like protein [Planococcus citri]|uniref:mpv17-like protein n=1 Tax=Planococcus citri TaxID=170843 RepID=UPI0031FA1363